MFSQRTIDLFHSQTQAIRQSPLRSAQMTHLPGKGDLLVVGDLHNHVRNFERVQTYAALDKHPNRMVILQELIHGGLLGSQGEDSSFDMLASAVRWAERFPDRVHFLLANHDLAQVQGLAVMKDGYDLTQRFNLHLDLRFGAAAPALRKALCEWVYSLPLAAITVTGLFLSHSLPSGRDMATFDATVLRRPLVETDYVRPGSVYQLVWGRGQTAEVLAALSKAWWSDVFICGHQPQDTGFGVVRPNQLILDSSHNHGVLLHVDLARSYTLDDLCQAVVPLAALA